MTWLVSGLGGHRRRFAEAAAATAVALLGLGLWPAASSALLVTVGTPTAAFGTSMSYSSCSSCTQYQLVAPGSTLSVPSAGHVTAWRVAGNGPLALTVLRPSGSGLVVVAVSAAPAFAGAGTFPVDIPVVAGDQIGVDLFPTKGPVARVHFAYVAGSTFAETLGVAAVGTPLSVAASATGAISLNADVALAPIASAIDVRSGPVAGGTAVAISGTYLDGATSVTFGGTPVPFALGTAGQLLVRSPPWPAPGQVDVVVHGPGGSSTLSGAFTYAANGSPAAGGGTKSPLTPGVAGAPPVVRSLSISPAAFLAAASGASLAATATGARLTYSDSLAATTRFTVSRRLDGRVVRGRGGVGRTCQPARGRVPAAGRCTRYVPLAPSFSHRDRAGANVLRLTGRLGGRALAPGLYRLSAVATDVAGDPSRPAVQAFRILAAPRR